MVDSMTLTIGQVPDVAPDIERSGPITRLGDITTHTGRKLVVFEEADRLGQETGTDEEEESGGSDQEPVQGGAGASLVDDKADSDACDDTDNDGDRDGHCGFTERHLYPQLNVPCLSSNTE